MKILFIGDIVGRPGQDYTQTCLRSLVNQHRPDLVIANGENATHGRGINQVTLEHLYDIGIEVVTLGNHTWDQREIFDFIGEDARLVRPANYPPGTPGQGETVIRVNGNPVLIINVMGRTFLSALDCPFRTVDSILERYPGIKHVIVDMHAETTSEKLAMGWYLDGRASAVLGTHTHVQTADEVVLPKGTAYITDVGMVGPNQGILGMDREPVIQRFITQLPNRFQVASGPNQFCAVLIELDDELGCAKTVQRIRMVESSRNI